MTSSVKWSLKNVKSGVITPITKNTFKVGRHANADLHSESSVLSRNHATLIVVDDKLHVLDQKSCNGTFKNDVKLSEELMQLNHGDVIGFGCSQKMIRGVNTEILPFIFQVILHAEPSTSMVIEPEQPGPLKDEEPAKSANPVVFDESKKEVIEINDAESSMSAVEIDLGKPKDEVIKINDAEPTTSVNEIAPEEPERYIECIVISDDENDDFSCSQIFEISAKIKHEQTSLRESVDPYFEIKQELQDLDYCEKSTPVDLTDDDEIKSDRDLLKILESEPNFGDDHEPDDVQERVEFRKVNKDNEEKADTSEKEAEPRFEDNHEPDGVRERVECRKVNDNNEEKEDDLKKIACKEIYVSVEKIQIKARTNNEKTEDKPQDKTKSYSKYTKPPIIQPHIEHRKGRRESEEKLAASVKEGKRKSIEESKPSKKLKTIEPKNNLKALNIDLEKQRNEKEKNKEERKRKLKEISEKNKVSTEPIKINKTIPKVKVSDSRGNFLLDIPSTSKKYSCNVKTSIEKPKTSIEKPKTNSKIEGRSKYPDTSSTSAVNKNKTKVTTFVKPLNQPFNNQIQDTTISSNVSPKSDTDDCMITQISFPNKRSEHLNTKPDSTVTERLGFGRGITLNNFLPTQSCTISRFKSRMDNVDDEICKIVKWKVHWLSEQNNLEISPPVYGDLRPQQIPLSFNKDSQYFDVMTPLIMLEMWQYVYQTLRNQDEERAPVCVNLVHSRKLGTTTYLDCECYIPEDKLNNTFRTEDLALIELKLRDHFRCYQFIAFGYIKFSARLNNYGDPNRPNFKFTIITKSLPYEIHGEQMLIKILANISGFTRLFKTMRYLMASPLCRRILNPDINDYLIPTQSSYVNPRMQLNREQMHIAVEAAAMCLDDRPGIYLVKGPPGTGKTTVIVNIVLEILFNSQHGKEPRILLTAPSNTAVDNLIIKLSNFRSKLKPEDRKLIKLIRIGPDSSISKNVDKFKLSSLARNNIIASEKLHCLETFNEHLKGGRDRDEFLRKYFRGNYNFVVKTAEDKLLLGSNVICTTLNSCVGHKLLQHSKKNSINFTCAIIDESTQCTELESLIPLQLGVERFVLVGDPQQLPAVVCNKDAHCFGYGKSLFSRIAENFKNDSRQVVKMLYEQYRMKPEICEYPNKTFYEGKLRSYPVHSNRIEPSIKPYLLFNLTRINDEESDYVNYDEVIVIYNLLETLRRHIKQSCKYSIGIITPYRAQKELLINTISSINFEPDVSLTVNTVDSFQGMENDIIIISCVRYSANNFLQNEQRLNVALTRARQGLYIVGNYNLFKDCKSFYDLRENAKSRKLCLDITGDPRNFPNYHKFIFY